MLGFANVGGLLLLLRLFGFGAESQPYEVLTPFDKQFLAFAAFENDLMRDLIPFVEKTYAVRADREERALAGLSIGALQSLKFGLNHLDEFAWVGAFSGAIGSDDVPGPDAAAKRLRLLWLSVGDRDWL